MTARMCMGGGKLNATFNMGPLNAWFDVFLDFLINFRPYKFAADGVISVGVRFALDLWLVTSRVDAEIGARLSVLGPPMAGRVHVDFWVSGFDIEFGDRDAALTEGMANTDSREVQGSSTTDRRRLHELEVPIKDENKTIFALPMRQRRQLDSRIEVEITQQDAGATYFRTWNDDERREDRWLVKPTVKKVHKNF
ncbi:hypothetical protein ACHAPE_009190 [Trichoderma viride]